MAQVITDGIKSSGLAIRQKMIKAVGNFKLKMIGEPFGIIIPGGNEEIAPNRSHADLHQESQCCVSGAGGASSPKLQLGAGVI